MTTDHALVIVNDLIDRLTAGKAVIYSRQLIQALLALSTAARERKRLHGVNAGPRQRSADVQSGAVEADRGPAQE